MVRKGNLTKTVFEKKPWGISCHVKPLLQRCHCTYKLAKIQVKVVSESFTNWITIWIRKYILGASPNRFFVSHCSAKRSILVSCQVRPVFNSCVIAPALSHWHQNLTLRETQSLPSVVFLLWCKPVYNAVPSLKWNRELLAWMGRHIVFHFNLQIFFCSSRLALVTVSAKEQMGRDFYSGTSKWNLNHVAWVT